MHTFTKHNHIEVCEDAKNIAIQAGQLILSAWGQKKHFDSKNSNGTDLVTQTDKQVERFIFEQLRLLFPLHKYQIKFHGWCQDF